MSQEDIDQLARWRVLGARNSEAVVALAPKVLAGGNVGENEWAVREQLAIAALDLGQLDLATTQLKALKAKFPKSPRVDLLTGLKLEAMGEAERARGVYRVLLKDDECNVSAHQRLVSLAPTAQDRIKALLSYLDTFYGDAAAWSFLADLYADQGAYGQSLTALGHVMLLQTWDSAAVERAGETAYTMGDYQLALKYFLRALEMETPPEGKAAGAKTRVWWGIRMCTKRLLEKPYPTSVPDDDVSTPAQLRKLAELATEQILDKGGRNAVETREVLSSMV